MLYLIFLNSVDLIRMSETRNESNYESLLRTRLKIRKFWAKMEFSIIYKAQKLKTCAAKSHLHQKKPLNLIPRRSSSRSVQKLINCRQVIHHVFTVCLTNSSTSLRLQSESIYKAFFLLFGTETVSRTVFATQKVS